MRSRPTRLALAAVAALAVTALAAPALTSPAAAGPGHGEPGRPHQPGKASELRFATFNASLNRAAAGDLVRDLSTPDNAQAAAIAETIQRTDPDVVLLINEFDYVEGGRAAELFRDNYLEVGHNGAAPVDYPYYFVAPVNTGVPSGFDLNNNGTVGGRRRRLRLRAVPRASTAWSSTRSTRSRPTTSAPSSTSSGRTCRAPLLPDDPATRGAGRLVLPRGARRLPALVEVPLGRPDQGARPQARPLPRLAPDAAHLRRRRGPQRHPQPRRDPLLGRLRRAAAGGRRTSTTTRGGPAASAAGRTSSSPATRTPTPSTATPYDDAIHQLLDHPRIQDPHPTSAGAVEATLRDGGANLTHEGPAAEDTADFADTQPGNLRADYVLPASGSRHAAPACSGSSPPTRCSRA